MKAWKRIAGRALLIGLVWLVPLIAVKRELWRAWKNLGWISQTRHEYWLWKQAYRSLSTDRPDPNAERIRQFKSLFAEAACQSDQRTKPAIRRTGSE